MESEYDGTGSGHEPYGEPGYGAAAWHDGSPGAEVADALVADLSDNYEVAYDGEPIGEHDYVGRCAEELAIRVVSDAELAEDELRIDRDQVEEDVDLAR